MSFRKRSKFKVNNQESSTTTTSIKRNKIQLQYNDEDDEDEGANDLITTNRISQTTNVNAGILMAPKLQKKFEGIKSPSIIDDEDIPMVDNSFYKSLYNKDDQNIDMAATNANIDSIGGNDNTNKIMNMDDLNELGLIPNDSATSDIKPTFNKRLKINVKGEEKMYTKLLNEEDKHELNEIITKQGGIEKHNDKDITGFNFGMDEFEDERLAVTDKEKRINENNRKIAIEKALNNDDQEELGDLRNHNDWEYNQLHNSTLNINMSPTAEQFQAKLILSKAPKLATIHEPKVSIDYIRGKVVELQKQKKMILVQRSTLANEILTLNQEIESIINDLKNI